MCAWLHQIVAAFTLFAGCSAAPAAEPRAELPGPARLNFVFVLADDLGWTDLGCMGSDLYETPHIDRLAAEGVRFTSACSACTVCSPTRAAILTGKYPARLHLTDWIPGHERPRAKLRIPEWTQYLPREEVTVAEVLKGAGYATASIGKWHLGGREFWPESQGFDVNKGGCERGQPPSYFSPYKIPTLEDGPAGEYLTDREASEACRFIEKNRDKPFFLYLPHHAVHMPLQAKEAAIEECRGRVKAGMRHTNPTYAAMIRSLDESVGRIAAKLAELKLSDRTAIVFTSDNGGLLGNARSPVTSNVPLRAGKGSSYEGGVRVPLIVKWPGVAPAGAVCDEPVISVDFYPTILEMASVKGKHDEAVDGTSLVPLLRNPKENLSRDSIYWHYPHYHPGGATPYGAVRQRDWKLIEFYEDMHVELYRIGADIGEKKDLSEEMPEKRDELRKALHEWRKRVGAQMPVANPDFVPEGASERP